MKINLHELRLRSNLTIRWLSRISHISAGTISKIERGEINPSIAIICKLCCSLNVKIDEMVDCREE